MRDTLYFSKLRVFLAGWRWRLQRFRPSQWRRWQRTHRTTYSPRPASLFTLEPLEARVLLAADLTGVVGATTLIDPAVPTNAATATVQVVNQGNQRANATTQVAIYSSADTAFDASDVLLGTANTAALNVGQSRNVTVNLRIPNELSPGSYNLLARVDATNVIAEGEAGEANNVAVRATQFTVAWQFGNVPGRSGNTVLTLTDADGTNATFRLTGPGLGEVIRDGANWDVKVTGTTASSALTVTTNNGGNDRVTLNDVHVFGPLASFTAATTDLTGTLAIDGPVNIPGLLPGTVTLGSIQGGTVAVPSVEAFTVLGSVTNARFFIGTGLGADGQLGGTGATADSYGQGRLGLLTITGNMTGTTVRVGVNPTDGIYGNGNDQLVGGAASAIGGIIIGGNLSADSSFIAGSFPTRYFAGSLNPRLTAGDPHFTTDPNAGGPSLNAALQQDTGSSTTDGLTNKPTIIGTVTDAQGIATFTAGFGATPTFNVLADRQADGSFTFTQARLEQINGGPLTDGPLTLTLRATDTSGNATQMALSFRLDRSAPATLTFDLAVASDTAPVGDQQTTQSLVTLAGETDANVLVELVSLGLITSANGVGAFSFSNVALALGANSFTVRVTDTAGNQRTEIRTITRLSAANQAPVAVNDAFTMTAGGALSGVPFLVKDIAPGTGSSTPLNLVDVNGTLFFTADTTGVGRELWKSDGTSAGTVLVKDIVGGIGSSSPQVLTNVNGTLFFFADNGVTGVELWKSDGTAAGTVLVKDINPGAGSTLLSSFTPTVAAVNNTLFFTAFDPINGVELWKSDGTEAGTMLVKDIRPGANPNNSFPDLLTDANGTLFFVANDGVSGPELWKSDGTAAGTVLVQNVNPAGGLHITELEAVNGTIFFTANDGNGLELWKSDGTVGGAVQVANLNGALGANPRSLTNVNGTLFFIANDSASGSELWKTDGTAAGTGLVSDMNPGSGSSNATFLTAVDGKLFFRNVLPGGDFELWVSDGTALGTTSLGVGIPDTANGSPLITDVNGVAYVRAGGTGNDLWKSDGTVAGTVAVIAGIVPRELVNVGDALYFSGVSSGIGRELFTLDGEANVLANDSDPEGSALTAILVSGPSNGTLVLNADGTFSYTPNAGFTGTDSFTYKANDGTLDSNVATVTITVTAAPVTNQAPVLTAIGNQTINEGQQLSFTATATDPNAGQAWTFSLANGTSGLVPAGATINPTTGAFSWTPTEAQGPGTYTFDVVVTDNGSPTLSDRETITVTVGDVNQTPTLAPIADQTVTVGQLLSFTAVGSDTDLPANTLTYSLEGTVPAGAAINPTTGAFTWTPTAGQVGAQSVTVRVTDNGTPSLFSEHVVNITVAAIPNQAPVLDPIGNQTISEHLPFTFTATASDPDASQTLTFSLENGTSGAIPVGATINPTTGLFSWTPTEAQGSGTFTFDVVVADNGSATLTDRETITLTVNEANAAPVLLTGSVPVGQVDSPLTPVGPVGNLVRDIMKLAPGSGPGTFNVSDSDAGAVTGMAISTQAGLPLWYSLDNGTTWTPFSSNLGNVRLLAADANTRLFVSPPSIDFAGSRANEFLFQAWDQTVGTNGGVITTGTLTGPTGAFSTTFAQATVIFIEDQVTNQAPVLAAIGNQSIDEGQALTFTATASDPNVGQTLTFSLAAGTSGLVPAGASINPTTGVFNWTPTEAQGPGTFTFDVVVTDNGSPNLSDRETITITVTEANAAPVLNVAATPTLVVDEDAPGPVGAVGTLIATLVDMTPPAGGLDNVTDPDAAAVTGVAIVGRNSSFNWFYSLNGGSSWTAFGSAGQGPSSALLLAADSLTRIYAQPNVPNMTGSDLFGFDFRAWDQTSGTNGGTVNTAGAIGGAGAFSVNVDSVRVTINSANDAPVLSSIGNQTIDEGQPLTFTATANDADAGQALTFSLDNGTSGLVPAGATIDSSTGAFSWTPTEAQGPGTFTFDVAVTDNGSPNLTDRETITVTVNEANAAPVLLTGSVPIGQIDSPLTPVGPVGNLVRDIMKLAPGSGPGTFNVNDSDAGAVTGIAISSQAGLQLWYSLNNGTTWVPFSSSLSNLRLLAADASTRLFVSPPSVDFAGTRANEFLFQAWDQTVGTNGGVITTGTLTGPTGAFSSGFAQATVIFIDNQVTNQAPVLAAIGNQSIDEGQPLSFTATASDPNAGQTLTFSLANGTSGSVPAGASINPTTGVFTWTPTEAQGPGTVTFDIVVTDNGSLTLSDRETITVTVGELNQQPTLDPIAAQTVTAGQVLSFTAVGSDADVPANTLTYSLQGTVPVGASLDPNTGAFTWTPTAGQIGPHTVTVRVTDNGTPNLFAEQVVSITVDAIPNQAPTLNAIGNQTISEHLPFTFTATASDPDASQTLTFSLENGTSGLVPAGASINATTGAFSWTPTEVQGPGTFTFDVVVTDNGSPNLSDRETITITVTEANAAPVLLRGSVPIGQVDSPLVPVGPVGTLVSAIADLLPPAGGADSISDSDAGAVTGIAISSQAGLQLWYSLDNGTTWTPFSSNLSNVRLLAADANTRLFVSPPSIDFAGSRANEFLFQAWDQTAGTNGGVITTGTLTGPTGAFSSTFAQATVIFIDTQVTNQAPVLTAIGTQSIDEGQALTFTATATDPNAGQTRTFSLANGTSGLVPAGATINPTTGAFSWTPTEAQGPGTYTFDVVVTDNGSPTLSDRETITVTVGDVNQAPSVAAIPTQNVTVGQLLSVTAVGSDLDLPANTLTYSLQGTVPAGASIDPNTGAFTWTPTAGQVGPHSLTLRVTDNGSPNLFAEQTVNVTVSSDNQAPVALNDAFSIQEGSALIVGTSLVKDIAPGLASSAISNLFAVGDRLFFAIDNGGSSTDLWASDGTAAGTALVKSGFVGSTGAGFFGQMVDVNGTLFFKATDSVNGTELWKSDGTLAGTQLVKDIQPATGDGISRSAGFNSAANVNGTLYFVGIDATTGFELWKSDGTAAGTVLVKDIVVGGSSRPSELTNVNGTLFFVAQDNVAGLELFKSDGTAAGTVVVKDINVGGFGSNPRLLTNVNGTVFFVANDGVNGNELWKSDGTAAGTVLVKNITSASGTAGPGQLTSVGSRLFFTVDDGVHGSEIWTSDGTEAGTVMVKDIVAGGGTSLPQNLINVNGSLFFSSNDGINGSELWKSDGTEAGTLLVKDIIPGAGGSIGTVNFWKVAANGELLFTPSDGVTGTELWKSDGTAAGTVLVKNIAPVGSSSPAQLTNVNGTVFFTADDNVHGREIWKSGGSETVLGNDSDPEGSALTAILVSGPANGTLTLNADGTFNYTPNSGFTGTDTFTYKANDGSLDSNIATVTITVTAAPVVNQAPVLNAVGNKNVDEGQLLSFTAGATDSGAGQTLTFSLANGTSGAIPAGASINPTTGAFSWTPTEAQGPGTFTFDVVVTDNGTPNLSDGETITITVGEVNQAPTLNAIPAQNATVGQLLSVTAVGSDADLPANTLTYSLQGTVPAGATINPTTGEFSWTPTAGQVGPQSVTVRVTDSGTPNLFAEQVVSITVSSSNQAPVAVDDSFTMTAGGSLSGVPVLVKDINPGSLSAFPTSGSTLVNINGTVYFAALVNGQGTELWKSDGTAAGTVLVKDIVAGSGSSDPANLTNVNGTLFFTAFDATNGMELWKSDGTAAGTVLVKDIFAGLGTSGLQFLTNVNGTLFFSANGSGGNGIELWKSDGTAAGTVLVANISPSGNSNPGNLTDVNGTLFFTAIDGVTGRELWKSDGTAAGTVLVKDISTGAFSASPDSLTNVNGTLFFSVTDGFERELWKSNGTAAGTVLVKNLNGGGSSNPAGLTNVNGTLFFQAVDVGIGVELFKSDGTAAGTVLVKDITPGAGSSTLTDLTNVGGTLFFRGPRTGGSLALWVSDGTVAGTIELAPGGLALPGLANVGPFLTDVNGTAFFSAGGTGNDLWKSDGTVAGTVPVGTGLAPQGLTTVGSTLFFTGTPGGVGRELMKVNGEANVLANDSDPEGSALTAILVSGPANGTLTLNPDGTFNYTPNSGFTGTDTFTYKANDGSLDSNVATVTITVTAAPVVNQAPTLNAIGNQTVGEEQALTFTATASDPDAGQTLTFSLANGTSGAVPGGATINATTGAFSWTPTEAQGLGTYTFDVVVADNGSPTLSDRETITVTVNEVNQAPVLNAIGNQAVNEGALLSFTATASDGDLPANALTYSLEGPIPAGATINATTGEFTWTPTAGQIGPHSVTIRVTDNGSPVLFDEETITITINAVNVTPTATNDSYTVQQDSTLIAETLLVKDIVAGTGASNPSNFINVNGMLFFTASDGVNGTELWKSDGTAAGTMMVKDISPGSAGSGIGGVGGLANVNGTLFFTASDGVNGVELWKSDGTEGGTVLVKDILVGSGSPNIGELTNVNGTLFFRANDGTTGQELWKSDGTAAGTVLVKDIQIGSGGSGPQFLTNVNGTLYFSATDSVNGQELWKSDGTAAGTVLVKDINPGTGGVVFNLTNVNGTLYFVADDPVSGQELWKTDGTNAGTVLVKDVRAGIQGGSLVNLTNVSGTLFFSANDGVGGRELWRSDGTEAGTVLVKDIIPGSANSSPGFLTNVNGTLYFSATDSVNGQELWKSDGTAAGTVLVKDINPGGSSGPANLTDVNGSLFFTANDGVNGVELWKSDGTAAGTALVKGINPGSGSSSPLFLTSVSGTLFFRATNVSNGSELWASGLQNSLLANDNDPDSPTLTATLGTGPLNGSLVLNPDGTFTYRPNAGFTGTDTFTYSVSDGTTTSNLATVTITVTA